MRVVERDLGADEAAAQALSHAGSIDRGDFATFQLRAMEVLGHTSGFTFVLTDASGQQIINLLRPVGSTLPRHGSPELLRRALDTRKPIVSDLYIGDVTGKPQLAIEVPVIRGGTALYSLGLGLEPRHFDELLKQQGLPQEWVVSIFDRTGTILARSHAAEQYVGLKGAPALTKAMNLAQEGVVDTPTLEGIPVVEAFSRSTPYGWTVAIGVPEATLAADLRRTLTLYAIGASSLLLIGLGLAAVIGRSVARSLLGLTATAQAIGKGEPVSTPALGLKEVDEVRRALLQAQQLLRQQELERYLAEQAERQMLVAKLAAEKANEARAVFLASVSHELRTPLNAILGFCRLMRDAKDVTAEQVRKLDIINNGGEHLLRLINNLLNMARIESGRMVLEETTFDLHQLLHETRALMQVQAAGKGLKLHLVLSPGVPRFVTTDAGKLRQVLINLLGNAIKFTGAGAVWLRAETTPQDSAELARVRFEVEDSGPGIPEKDRERIFAPFERLIETTGAEIGTGLGLHISKQFVELMGGTIDLSTVPGKGSEFHFEIPLRIARPGDGVRAKSDRGRVTGLAPGQQRYRLLIADDELANRQLLHALLEPLGFDLREAVNGREAVAFAEQWRPHLVWMDVRMPEMDGLEATRQIKAGAAGAQTRIVALTAHAEEDERVDILAAGCDDVIRKPYRHAEIFDALETNLGVRFSYAEERLSAAIAEAAELSVGPLLKLPAVLLEELRQAAVLLDGPRCIELAGKIDAIDDELGARLRRMIGNLQYQELLDVLDQSIGVRSA
jgi:signal transduction histidine kinase/CheY-like chemotaxis protein